MPEPTDNFSLRLPTRLHRRLLGVCAATGSEVTRSGLVVQAVELFLKALEVCPGMVEGYDPRKDRSVMQGKKPSCKAADGNAGRRRDERDAIQDQQKGYLAGD